MSGFDWLYDVYGIKLGETDEKDRVIIHQQIGNVTVNSSQTNVDVNNIIHTGGEYIELNANGEELFLSSTDALDVGGLINVFGLDKDGIIARTFHAAQGLTSFSIGIWSWVYSITNVSTFPFVGIVRVYTNDNPINDNIKAQIDEHNRSENIMFKAPKNMKAGFVMQGLSTMSRAQGSINRNANLTLKFSQKINGSHTEYISFLHNTLSLTGNTTEQFLPVIPVRISAETKIKWTIESVTDNATSISGIFEIMMILGDKKGASIINGI